MSLEPKYYMFLSFLLKEVNNMNEKNLKEIEKEIIEDIIPNIKKYEKQGKNKILLKGITIGMKIAEIDNEKTA